MDKEPNSEQWLMVAAVSLGVTLEEAVCVITDGAMVSSSTEVLFKGEGTMGAAEPRSCPWRHCDRGSCDNC